MVLLKEIWEDFMNYQIIRGDESALEKANDALIQDVPWGSTYTPDCRFRGIYMEGKGFLFRLTCYETNPRITYLEPGGEVCEDSCLEIFLNFAPEKSRSYINFEMNDRVDLNTPEMPKVKATVLEDRWEAELFIPLSTIYNVYGKIDFAPGYTFTGNAFKCGDLTDEPHYISWSPLQRDAIDFHRSDRFGTFEIM